MKKTVALFLLVLFATIALPIRGANGFNNNIVEEEIVAKKNLETNGYETFYFSDEFLKVSAEASLHYQYKVALKESPYLAVPSQPPNVLM